MVKGGVVSFKAHSQRGVTRSSNEAETISFTDTAASDLKIQNYLTDMGMETTSPPTVHVDNANVIKTCHNVAITTAARHYVQAYHWGREQYREGRIKLQQVTSHLTSSPSRCSGVSMSSIDRLWAWFHVATYFQA